MKTSVIDLVRPRKQPQTEEPAARRASEAAGALEQRKRLQKLYIKLDIARNAVEQAARESAALIAALNDAQQALDVMETSRTEGQTAIMAKRLIPGAPCPVCGSTDHPSPAHSDKPIPEEDAVKASKAHIQKLTSQREEKERLKAAAEKELLTTELEMRSIEERLGEWSLKSIKELENARDEAQRDLQKAQNAKETLSSMLQQRQSLEKKVSQIKERIPALEESHGQAQADSARCLAIVEERSSAVPDDLRDAKKLKTAIGRARALYEVMEADLEKSRKKLSAAEKQLAASEKALEGAETSALESQRQALIQRQGAG